MKQIQIEYKQKQFKGGLPEEYMLNNAGHTF